MRWALLALAACGAPAVRTADVTVAPLGTSDRVVAAVERGAALYVFSPHALTIWRGGAATLVPAPNGWQSAAAIPALGGASGTWLVALDDQGALWRVAADGELDPLGAAFGLDDAHLFAVRAAGKTIAFDLPDAVAATRDELHVARFGLPDHASLAAGRDRIALLHDRTVEVWDLAAATRRTYAVPRAREVLFVDAARAPRLAIRTADDELYVESDGALHAAAAHVHAAAAAGARLWVLAGNPSRLALVEAGALVEAPAAAPGGTALVGLAGGDVLLSRGATVERYAVARATDDPRWNASVAPIFARVCAKCHLPGGDGGIDLSTAAAWRAERGELRARVVEGRTMPPAGTELSEADRLALSDWLSRP